MTPANRIRAATGTDLTPLLAPLAAWGLEEEGGLALEAWLAATGAPALHAAALAEADPATAEAFARLLAVSRPVAAILRQNPEFASLLLEPGGEADPEELRASIVAEGRRLLAASTSPSHRLDRLRWLRQKWSLLLALAPVEDGRWQSESDVADALIELAREVAWSDLAPRPEGECPVLVVGFGKLGGRELNRSSDIDLVYALPDGLDDRTQKAALRWAEAFGRAMESPMGRGALYRVDLRLRPFGRSGDLVRAMRGIESYYRNYAESWEIQALLRSRPIAGPPGLAARWDAMRAETLRRTIWSPERIAEIVESRERTERAADPADLKRAAGGIRDVEWIAQIGTLLGYEGEGPESTHAMLDRLVVRGALSVPEVQALQRNYRTLREIEDALQLRDGRQTHVWPDDPRERLAVSSVLDGLYSEFNLVPIREEVAELYGQRLGGDSATAPVPNLGTSESETVAYLARFAGADAYVRSVRENEGSLARLSRALTLAPRLMERLRDPEPLEELLSGEIAEKRSGPPPFDAAGFRRAHARTWLRYALTEAEPVWRLPYEILRRAFGGSGIFPVVLGSVATATHGPWSDLDLLLLHDDELSPARAEDAARRALDTLRDYQREGAPGAFDLRLRPDGGRGALVRSLRALARYAEEGMAPWERLALGNAMWAFPDAKTEPSGERWQPVFGLLKEIVARPLTSEDRRELWEIKDRVERERSGGADDLKLGPGGLMDLEWCVRLDEMEQGAFFPGPLEWRVPDTLLVALERIVNARIRADLGGPAPDPAALAEARGWVREELLRRRASS